MNADTEGGPGEAEDQGRAVPPYDGRKEAADVEPAAGEEAAGMHEAGANVAGGQRPKESDRMKADDPEDTPGGGQATPAHETPAAESGGDEPDEGSTGPGHTPGTPTGERGGS